MGKITYGESNASVIAAAPEMYALLNKLSDYFENREDIQNGECMESEWLLFDSIVKLLASIDGATNAEKQESDP